MKWSELFGIWFSDDSLSVSSSSYDMN